MEISTGFFYVGSDTWKFRFTGVLEGIWEFESVSEIPDFIGQQGSIRVEQGLDRVEGNYYEIYTNPRIYRLGKGLHKILNTTPVIGFPGG